MIADQPAQNQNNEVLIVDDSPANLRLLIDILKADGYPIRQAASGELALRCIAKKLPAIILLDVMMPEMDGFEVCRYLKSNPKTSNIPVIFISALDDEQSKLTGFQVGGVDYITKPFRKDEVLARVRTHINLHNLLFELEIQKKSLYKEIGERILTEEKLRESEEKYRTTLYGIGDGVITTDKEGRVKMLNPVAETLTGWTQAEAEGMEMKKVFCILNEQTRGKVEIPVSQVLNDGAVVGLVNQALLIARDGNEIPVTDGSIKNNQK